jgi:hypothetical protein
LTEASARLAVVVPGFCGPALDIPATGYLSEPLPALERLLSRARVVMEPASDLEGVLAAFFRVPGGDGSVSAVAPLTWLADTGERTTGFIMRADPIHLRADQACLRLFDSTTFELDAREADELVTAFNDYFNPQGLRLHAPSPIRWYLTLNEAPELATVAPAQLAGRDISEGLPQGRAGAHWHAVLNEVQMLFHTLPVNLAREQRGVPAVNSIWPWGGGFLPATVSTRLSGVIADSPHLRGLAQLGGVACRDLPGSAADLRVESRCGLQLVWLDRLERAWRYGEVEAWCDGLRQLEQLWFMPLLERLLQGSIGQLDLYLGSAGHHEISRRRLRYFWKTDRSLAWHCGHA